MSRVKNLVERNQEEEMNQLKNRQTRVTTHYANDIVPCPFDLVLRFWEVGYSNLIVCCSKIENSIGRD